LYARARELLHLIDDLLAFVITPTGISFGVLVREDRTGGLEDGAGNVVLTRNQPQLVSFAELFLTNEASDLGIPGSKGWVAQHGGARHGAHRVVVRLLPR